MDPVTQQALTHAGAFCAIGLAAFGSALGCGAAGAAAVGAWKRCYVQNEPAPFQLVVFAGAPLSQTIYGMILMFLISGKAATMSASWPVFLIMGIVGGLGMGISAWMQGRAAAGSCDSFGETNKGFVNDLMVLGIIETVAIFVMAFGIVLLTKI